MSLRQKQSRFFKLTARLIDKVHELGYEATWGDAYRDHRVHGPPGVKGSYSHPSSTHKQRLAVDLNLFKDGRFITNDEGHRLLGAWWKQQDPDARWGGDFRDPNHYSFEHEGAK